MQQVPTPWPLFSYNLRHDQYLLNERWINPAKDLISHALELFHFCLFCCNLLLSHMKTFIAPLSSIIYLDVVVSGTVVVSGALVVVSGTLVVVSGTLVVGCVVTGFVVGCCATASTTTLSVAVLAVYA